MQFYKFLYLFLPLGLVCAQTTAPSASKPKPPATGKAIGVVEKPGVVAPKAGAAAPKTDTTGATGADKVVLTIGDERITEKQFNTYVQTLPPNMQAQATGPMKREFAEQVVRLKLLAQEAKKRGLEKDPLFQAKMNFQYENMLAAQLYTALQTSASPDAAALKKMYDEHKGEAEEIQAKHILIRFKGSPVPLKDGKKDLTEEEALAKAQELRKEIVAGKDFAEVAKAESDDTGSGANGGDLGKFKHGQMVPQFEQAAFALQAGQLSEPVKTQFGYHIIKVESHATKSFDEMKPELEARAKPEAAKQAVDEMRKSANVKFDDSFFGPAPAAAPATAPPPAAAAPATVTPAAPPVAQAK